MPTVGAIANGPILFTKVDGSQISIPVYMLSFVDGVLQAPPAPFTIADPWLKHLVTTGFIKEEPPRPTPTSPPSPPVLTLTAATPGVWGNNILATITYRSGPVDFTVKVAVSISFDLDTTTMASVLGTELIAPSHAGPALVVGTTLVSGSTPKNTTTPLALGVTPLVISKFDSSGTAFEFVARKSPPGSNLISVAISNAVAGNSHFTLTLGWTGISTSIGFGVPSEPTLSTVRTQITTAVGYLVDVVYNGGKPKAGVFGLTGGTDGARASTSTPTVQ